MPPRPSCRRPRPAEVRDPVGPRSRPFFCSSSATWPRWPAACRGDVQQHLAARHAHGLAVGEGEGERLVDVFRQQRIGIVGTPVAARADSGRSRPRPDVVGVSARSRELLRQDAAEPVGVAAGVAPLPAGEARRRRRQFARASCARARTFMHPFSASRFRASCRMGLVPIAVGPRSRRLPLRPRRRPGTSPTARRTACRSRRG